MTYIGNIFDCREILCREHIGTLLLLLNRTSVYFILFFTFSFGCSFLHIKFARVL